MLSRFVRFVEWWGRKGIAFLISVVAIIWGAHWLKPESVEPMGMWITACLATFCGSNAVISAVETRVAGKVAGKPTPPKPPAAPEQEGS